MSNIKIVDVYCAWADDGNDVRTLKGKFIGASKLKETANYLAKGHGWYGGSGIVEKNKALLMNGLYYILAVGKGVELKEPSVKIKKKKEANEFLSKTLLKLSEKEAKSLGLLKKWKKAMGV